MPTIYLIRHGKASPEAADYDELSATGHEQSRLVGAELARRGLELGPVVTGTLRRQRQTAVAALRGLDGAGGSGPEPVADPRWNEYDHLRLLERHTTGTGTLQERLDASLHAWTASDATGEGSWTAFRDGVRAALDELATSLTRGRTALVFTSAGVIATACATLMRAPEPVFVAMNRVVVNGSVTKLVHGRGGTRLLSFNDHAHLEHGGPDLMTFR
ncbi:histidine phosphatase family protein [Nocardiopsis sp. NPDC058789]|uniref:histidine phosphatase family protein n=1 Tax=Nocardiopsis sp. NPDC058789 TaxID=3346634 RepID=UPI0036720BD0